MPLKAGKYSREDIWERYGDEWLSTYNSMMSGEADNTEWVHVLRKIQAMYDGVEIRGDRK